MSHLPPPPEPTSQPTPLSFEATIRVEAADIDELGHVNNLVYLRWVQEIATSHWQEMAPQQDQDELLWVISRHEIDYKSAAKLGDEIKLRTWVGEEHGLSFERFTAMHRASDGKLLAQARSLWIPINRKSRRPQRLRAALRAQFSFD